MNNDRRINLVSLLLYPFYHWRSILCAFLIFMVLGTAAVVLKGNEPETPDSNAAYNSYQYKLYNYLFEKSTLESSIELYRSKIQEKQDYMDNSVLMKIDPNNACYGEYKIQISTDYQIIPSMIYQTPDQRPYILSAYLELLSNEELQESIGHDSGLKYWQIDELVTIDIVSDDMLCIAVLGENEAQVRSILDAFVAFTPEAERTLQKTYGAFTATVLQNSVSQQKYPWLTELRNDQVNELLQIQKDYKDTIKQLQKLKKPSNNRSAKILILAAFAGFILPYGCFCLKLCFNRKLYSASSLDTFKGLVCLGSVFSGGKTDRLSMMLRKFEGRSLNNAEADLALIAENIQVYGAHAENLVLTGDCSDELLQKTADQLQALLPEKKVIAQGSILQCAAGVAALRSSDGVILVEKCLKSRMDNIRREVSKAADADKLLVGCIVIDF